MCGIMGYIGAGKTDTILLSGLKRLEYRGYDSAGVAIIQDGSIELARCKGKLSALEKIASKIKFHGQIGIGHTRWATHGKPSDENAHPHSSDNVVVVHNGIIENHIELRNALLKKGYRFASETDTEVIPWLIEDCYRKEKDFESAVRKSLKILKGSFAICVISLWEPSKIVVAKNSSPLIIGIGKGENFIASDIPAILNHTKNVIPLDDGEMAIISRNSVRITNFEGKELKRNPTKILWTPVMAEKEGYKHFMLKEIYEQPRAITDTIRGRVFEKEGEIDLNGLVLNPKFLAELKKISIVACGTSYHAALVGKFMIESLARIPVEVELASEFRYRNPILGKNDLVIMISQSGETADTLGALEEAKKKGAKVISICNVVDSSIARKSHHVLYTHAGPEIGVASTKAFTSQLAALFLLSLYLGRKSAHLKIADAKRLIGELNSLPKKMENALKQDAAIKKIAAQYCTSNHFFYLGRGLAYPIALEGALKLKEISYIHAEGYPGGEIKHGPIALIDEGIPVLVIAPPGPLREKILSNLEEVKTRGAKTILLTVEGDCESGHSVDTTIYVPSTDPLLLPLVEIIPLQLLAYYIALERGTDVDQPRNLAKSVTVE
jgi:glutamine---fructose-6-phosphate transaminase (isomerizing)